MPFLMRCRRILRTCGVGDHGDDFHGLVTTRAAQGVRLVDLLDQAGPCGAALPGRHRQLWQRLVGRTDAGGWLGLMVALPTLGSEAEEVRATGPRRRWWSCYNKKALSLSKQRYVVDEQLCSLLAEKAKAYWKENGLKEFEIADWGFNFYTAVDEEILESHSEAVIVGYDNSGDNHRYRRKVGGVGRYLVETSNR